MLRSVCSRLREFDSLKAEFCIASLESQLGTAERELAEAKSGWASCNEQQKRIAELEAQLSEARKAAGQGDRMRAFWNAQAEWSQATFGLDSERGPIGPLKHLAKEVQECLSEPYNAEEKVDCQFLVIDAQRRAGVTYDEHMDACFVKLAINKIERKWNKPGNDDEPIEHVRAPQEPA